MPTWLQAKRSIVLTTPLGPEILFPTTVALREGVSRLFSCQVECIGEAATTVAMEALLGKACKLKIQRVGEKGDVTVLRHVHGVCSRVDQGEIDLKYASYTLELVPTLWSATRRSNSLIFQRKTVPEVLKLVLADHGIKGEGLEDELKGKYEPRDFCVQYRETDFNFLSRLMEEEGIFYFFRHADGSHKMVLADEAKSSFKNLAVEPKIEFAPNSSVSALGGRIYSWQKSQEIRAKKVLLRDSNFQMYGNDLEAGATTPAAVPAGTVPHDLTAGNAAMELYDYPGEYAQRFDGITAGGGEQPDELKKTFTDNIRTAKIRAEQEMADAVTVRGSGDCGQMSAGGKFTVALVAGDLAQKPLKVEGAYALTEVSLSVSQPLPESGGGRFAMNVGFAAVPEKALYRPARVSPKPVVHGVQTAMVVGPSGEEIFTDKFGRVKVQFFWDRKGKKDADSSCWIRVGTVWAGTKWGGIHIPRIGQEVLVQFQEGDPDQPIIVGSVYNNEHMPPYDLPDHKTMSGIKSRSTLKGGPDNFNEIRFEDKKGKEHVYIHAERDALRVVENNDDEKIHNNQTVWIHHNRTEVIKEGDEKFTIEKGNREETLTKGDDTLMLTDGNRTETLKKGDDTLTLEKGNLGVTLKAGAMDTKIDGGGYTLIVTGGDIKAKASDKTIVLDGKLKLELVCGSSKITLTPDGIKIAAMKIDIEGQTTFEVRAMGIAMKAKLKHEVEAMIAKIKGTVQTEVEGLINNVKGGVMLAAKGAITMVN